ncbi:MAG: hypothetical protein AB8B53_05720 [Flavobacteriales bacterium]
MKRIFKDYRTITDDHLLLIRKKYPNGFSDNDLNTLKTSDGIYLEVLEIEANDSLYIFRMNNDLLSMIDEFIESPDTPVEQSDAS